MAKGNKTRRPGGIAIGLATAAGLLGLSLAASEAESQVVVRQTVTPGGPAFPYIPKAVSGPLPAQGPFGYPGPVYMGNGQFLGPVPQGVFPPQGQDYPYPRFPSGGQILRREIPGPNGGPPMVFYERCMPPPAVFGPPAFFPFGPSAIIEQRTYQGPERVEVFQGGQREEAQRPSAFEPGQILDDRAAIESMELYLRGTDVDFLGTNYCGDRVERPYVNLPDGTQVEADIVIKDGAQFPRGRSEMPVLVYYDDIPDLAVEQAGAGKVYCWRITKATVDGIDAQMDKMRALAPGSSY